MTSAHVRLGTVGASGSFVGSMKRRRKVKTKTKTRAQATTTATDNGGWQVENSWARIAIDTREAHNALGV
jgi:hypothetical protein